MQSELSLTIPVPNERPTNGSWVIGAFVLLGDVVTLALAAVMTIAILTAALGTLPTPVLHLYLYMWPVVGFFIAAYALAGLYPGVPLFPGAAVGYAEELRRLTLASTAVTVIILIGWLIFAWPAGGTGQGVLTPAAMVGTWILSVVLVPMNRSMLRLVLYRTPWWGYPVVIFGAGKTGEVVVRTLLRSPEMGLRPVAVLDDDDTKRGQIEGVPVLGGLHLARLIAENGRVPCAIMAMPGLSTQQMASFIESFGELFRCWLFITSPSAGYATLWVSGTQLRDPESSQDEPRPAVETLGWKFKGVIEYALAMLIGFVAFPLIGLIAILIKLDSPGPVFFVQRRPGVCGQPFTIFKFRTMHMDATKRMRELSPEQRAEFERYGKIRNDPRITRVGRWLRRTSLDELPQIINVLRGEMCLVGPRPYLKSQVSGMGHHKRVIFDAKPGVTGLWQISGRSTTTFEERLALDAFYVRNWSIWLDVSILIRTVFVVLFSRGAY